MRVATANYGGSFRRNSEIKASANPATLVVIVYSEALVRGATTSGVAPVAETGFSHRLNVYKIIRLFFGLSYLNISVNNQVENSFFFRISNISVPCPHAELRGRTIIKKLWIFSRPWGRHHSKSPPCLIFLVKQIHQSTASERTTWLHRMKAAESCCPLCWLSQSFTVCRINRLTELRHTTT